MKKGTGLPKGRGRPRSSRESENREQHNREHSKRALGWWHVEMDQVRQLQAAFKGTARLLGEEWYRYQRRLVGLGKPKPEPVGGAAAPKADRHAREEAEISAYWASETYPLEAAEARIHQGNYALFNERGFQGSALRAAVHHFNQLVRRLSEDSFWELPLSEVPVLEGFYGMDDRREVEQECESDSVDRD